MLDRKVEDVMHNGQNNSSPVVPACGMRRRVWPYIFAAAIIAGIVSAFCCYRYWITPAPPSVNDESSFLGEVIALGIMVLFVAGCTVAGALLGWLIWYFIRVRDPVPSETRNT